MRYFVTGATGFIGKRLVAKLLQRKGSMVHFLIRRESEHKIAALHEYWGVDAARAVPVFGDLTARKLGVAAGDIRKLRAFLPDALEFRSNDIDDPFNGDIRRLNW